jgi:hypothetical protein
MQPRRAVLIGVLFLVIAALYWIGPYLAGFMIDYAGITMLVALAVAMSIMAYVLLAGSQQG